MIFRFFSKLPSLSSPLTQYIESISKKNLPADLHKNHYFSLPDVQEQVKILQDIEQASIFRLKEFTNQEILALLKAYSMHDQGSHRLHKNIVQELYRRINSFTLTELSTIVYFFSTISETGRLFDIIKDLVMKDPLSIPKNSIGKLAFSYAVKEKHDTELFKALTNIFIVAKEDISLDTGLLFLTGIYKSGGMNPVLTPYIQSFIEKYWAQFNGNELAQCIFISFKLGMDDFADRKVKEIDLEKLAAADIDKITRCYLMKDKDPPQGLLEKLDEMFQSKKIGPYEVFELIYTLNSIKNNEKFFESIRNYLETNIHSFSGQEKISIFLAFISTSRENEQILQLFQREFNDLLYTTDILMLFPCFARRKNIFLPYTAKLIEYIRARIQGKELKIQESLMVMHCLIQADFQDHLFWTVCLNSLKYQRIKSAEDYIRVKKTVKNIGNLGIDVQDYLSFFIEKYEN